MPAERNAVVRDATEADLPRLIELLAQLTLDEQREDTREQDAYRDAFRQVEADPRQRLLVIESEGRVIGSAALIIVPNLTRQGRPWAVIENVVVDAEARDRGHGETLLRYAIDAAREAGCYKLSLTSNRRRKDAHRFYERLGFTATHESFRIAL